MPRVTPERYSWQKQELFKGTTYTALLSKWGGTYEGGWAFETKWVPRRDLSGRYDVVAKYSAAEANIAADSELMADPVFRHNPAWLVGSGALTASQVNEVLAKGIPALTPSTGETLLPTLARLAPDNQTDMWKAADVRPNGWPRIHKDYGTRWLHNDAKDMAYLYTYKIYEKLVDKGCLK